MLRRQSVADVTAVILSTGEATTTAALECVRRQSLAAADIVMVRDIYPFHRALNEGASLVTTPYFVQVDADMLLDPDCFAALRRAMKDDVGMAVGQLRDALVGRVIGVKLFRRACFDLAVFPDSISPDTDFGETISLHGWRTVYVGRQQPNGARGSRTFGEHRPAYHQPDYVFRKSIMEGQRYRHRFALGGLRWHDRQLAKSSHPNAPLARIAMAAGVFETTSGDALGRPDRTDHFARVWSILRAPPSVGPVPPWDPAEPRLPSERFALAWEHGRAVSDRRDGGGLRAALEALDQLPDDPSSFALRLGFCRGFVMGVDSRLDFRVLEDFFHRTDLHLRLGEDGSDDITLDKVFEYADKVGLERFVVAPSIGARFARSSGSFLKTGYASSRFDGAGRPRIDVPFQFLGAIICTDPERPAGLFWCADLLRRGYTRVHVPSPLGAYDEPLLGRAFRGLLERARRHLPNETTPLSPAAIRRMLKPPERPYTGTSGRVLMVIESLLRGGAERQLVALSHGLKARGYDVTVLSFAEFDPEAPHYEEELRAVGIEVIHGLSAASSNQLRLTGPLSGMHPAEIARLPRWLRDRVVTINQTVLSRKPELVHAWGDGPGTAALLGAGSLGMKSIVIQQGSMATPRQGHKGSVLMRRVYTALLGRIGATIINNSGAGAADSEDWLGLPRGAIKVRYNGFLTGSVRMVDDAEAVSFKGSLGWRADAPVVGTIMRIVDVKDPMLWLDTAGQILRERPQVNFLFAGYGQLEEATRARAKAIGLGDRIRFLGAVEDVGLVYSAMDVVLLTSRIEGVPNVMIEAQAVGRAVVAPDVGGTAEALAEGITGLIARPRDAESLAKTAVRILDDPAWRARIREAGPRFVAERFDVDAMVDATIGHYGIGRRALSPLGGGALVSEAPRQMEGAESRQALGFER